MAMFAGTVSAEARLSSLRPHLRSLGRRYSGPRAEAEDLIQEGSIAVIRILNVNPEASDPYLVTAARRAIVQSLRRTFGRDFDQHELPLMDHQASDPGGIDQAEQRILAKQLAQLFPMDILGYFDFEGTRSNAPPEQGVSTARTRVHRAIRVARVEALAIQLARAGA